MTVDIFNTDNKYQIIYADPPWEYRQSGSKTSSRGTAKQHYQTMSTEDICNLPIKNIATDNTVIFMWATLPNIAEAIKVIEAWGFTYKTAAFVWIKQNKKSNSLFWGMGAYTRANAEVCLLGIGKKVKAKELVKSHAAIARYWTEYLGINVKAVDVAVMMCLFKMARLQSNKFADLDSWVDLAGYAACGAEIATKLDASKLPYRLEE